MKKHNWTLLIVCKIYKKCPEPEAIYMKSISYGRVNDEKNTPRYSANYTHRIAIINAFIIAFINVSDQIKYPK